MCGIVGYIGNKTKITSVLERLKNLEYRGYDSSGVAYFSDEIKTIKTVGTIDKLFEKVSKIQSDICISHTRWATHGKVNETNAHPQVSHNKNFAVVHNGIIENYKNLKDNLGESVFASQTDTEVVANLLETFDGDTLSRLKNTTNKLVGSWALLVMDTSGEALYAAKNKSPLYATKTKNGFFLASDITCFDRGEYYCFEDGIIAKVTKSEIHFFNGDTEVPPKIYQNNCEYSDTHKGNFAYFMQKEIAETCQTLKNIAKTYKKLSKTMDFGSIFSKNDRILLCGCGTAYHACALGAKWFLKEGITAIAGVSSEVRYFGKITSSDTMILVSQSGETADTLAVLEKTKATGGKTVAITNCSHSTLARDADIVFPLCAGAEISVASTKAYSAMLAVLHILTHKCTEDAIEEIEEMSDKLIADISLEMIKQIAFSKRIFFIGRGDDGVTASEGALKLKETSYLDSYGYYAGELKHGTIALIESNVTVVAIITNKAVASKTMSSVEECLSRGAKAIVVTDQKLQTNAKIIQIDGKIAENLKSIAAIYPLQLLACKVADHRGCNPDRPRNLAKSVTVE